MDDGIQSVGKRRGLCSVSITGAVPAMLSVTVPVMALFTALVTALATVRSSF